MVVTSKLSSVDGFLDLALILEKTQGRPEMDWIPVVPKANVHNHVQFIWRCHSTEVDHRMVKNTLTHTSRSLVP